MLRGNIKGLLGKGERRSRLRGERELEVYHCEDDG